MSNAVVAVDAEGAYPVTYTEKGLLFHGDMSFERWTDLGNTLGRMVMYGTYWWADWLAWGEARFGEEAAQAVPEGIAAKTLMNARWVGSRIEPARRRPELGFSIHAEVAPLSPADQDSVLAQAAADDLSVREVREIVRAIQGKASKHRPVPPLVLDLRDIAHDLEVALAKSDMRTARGRAADGLVLLRDFVNGGYKEASR